MIVYIENPKKFSQKTLLKLLVAFKKSKNMKPIYKINSISEY